MAHFTKSKSFLLHCLNIVAGGEKTKDSTGDNSQMEEDNNSVEPRASEDEGVAAVQVEHVGEKCLPCHLNAPR